ISVSFILHKTIISCFQDGDLTLSCFLSQHANISILQSSITLLSFSILSNVGYFKPSFRPSFFHSLRSSSFSKTSSKSSIS
uniref:Uncharacterized protein n=1 Tax=Amphimedon queenslandica TaxID=400682 RepID=A0A1X7TQL8_AMPQE